MKPTGATIKSNSPPADVLVPSSEKKYSTYCTKIIHLHNGGLAKDPQNGGKYVPNG